jgi:hypothetical protein
MSVNITYHAGEGAGNLGEREKFFDFMKYYQFKT